MFCSWTDNYEVIDHCLKPIKDALRPSFEPNEISKLDQNRLLAQDAFGVSYLPGEPLEYWAAMMLHLLFSDWMQLSTGFIGLNNLKHTDYINVVVQALAHIPPLRDFFLANNVGKCKSPLVLRFGELIRKMWSPHNFKNTVRALSWSLAQYYLPFLIIGVFEYLAD